MIDFGQLLTVGLSQLIGPSAIFFALLALGLNIHFGYTGLLNFGQIGFALVGAYGMGISVANYGAPLWLGVLIGMACGVALALVLGIPTLRLRADYLAIVTIAASEILRLITRSTSQTGFTGGTQGLTGFADSFARANPFGTGTYDFGVLSLRGPDLWSILVGWTVVGLCVLLTWLLVRSPWGRVLKAIREDEDAARALGKNVFAYKMQALALGGVFGALGGIVFALATQSLTPDFYSPPQTFFAYAALILGGAGRVFGPVIGAMAFWFLLSVADAFLRQATAGESPLLPFISSQDVGAIRFVLVGLFLGLMMVFRPQGIFGRRREVLGDGR
ncbi:branched-chain amino acid ABC transporter permease [Pseudonocardia alni]|uniref:Branched-chain amino acid transport system permease protein n=1 Tax=Pseudonocardia alni TaxID=33907 RepID=A0A852VYM1_PSEA5|nr:branched-chain amino acid ABC transporter permease [Pseudonocardia antarctica]NYG00411.1 branched-chain amino acid transport system permease protein [Pseudonocardia antarctica]